MLLATAVGAGCTTAIPFDDQPAQDYVYGSAEPLRVSFLDQTGDAAWARVLPPMSELPLRERQWMLQDLRRWEAGLPPAWRSLYREDDAADAKVVAMRRA